MVLASGRYMETVGWMSVNGLDGPKDRSLDIQRRYLDNNRRTVSVVWATLSTKIDRLLQYKFHTSSPDFDTKEGVHLTHQLEQISKGFNLSYAYGQSPQSSSLVVSCPVFVAL